MDGISTLLSNASHHEHQPDPDPDPDPIHTPTPEPECTTNPINPPKQANTAAKRAAQMIKKIKKTLNREDAFNSLLADFKAIETDVNLLEGSNLELHELNEPFMKLKERVQGWDRKYKREKSMLVIRFRYHRSTSWLERRREFIGKAMARILIRAYPPLPII